MSLVLLILPKLVVDQVLLQLVTKARKVRPVLPVPRLLDLLVLLDRSP